MKIKDFFIILKLKLLIIFISSNKFPHGNSDVLTCVILTLKVVTPSGTVYVPEYCVQDVLVVYSPMSTSNQVPQEKVLLYQVLSSSMPKTQLISSPGETLTS